MKRKAKKKSLETAPRKHEDLDLDRYLDKYIYILVPVLAIAYYIFSLSSDGFYSDDEITHLMLMKRFFDEPASILGNFNKPGYKLIFALPSLLGYNFVHITHILLTASIAMAVYYLGKQIRIPNISVLALIFGFQPFVIQFSFRCYAELLAGLFILLTLIFYYKKKFILASIFSTYLFSIRQEYIIVSIILAFSLLYPVVKNFYLEKSGKITEPRSPDFNKQTGKRIVSFFVLWLCPLALGTIYFLQSGDPLSLLKEMKSYGIDWAGGMRDFLHYFRMYIFIVGPISVLLIAIGLIIPFLNKSKIKEYYRQYGLCYIIFLSSFTVQVMLAWEVLNISGNTGALRFLLPISPLTMIIAGIGLKSMLDTEKRNIVLLILFLTVIIIFLFLSKTSNGINLTAENDYTKFFIALIFLGVFLLIYFKIIDRKIFLIFIVFLSVSSAFIIEKPIKKISGGKPKGDYAIIDKAYEFWSKYNFKDRMTLCNHVYFLYLAGYEWWKENEKFKLINQTNLRSAPVGSICVWDQHYGYRPKHGFNDTPREFFANNPNFKKIFRINISDMEEACVIYEKVSDY